MNPQIQNTAGLRDIHLPDSVSWWPPAPGWWIVLIILLLAIYFIPKLYYRLTYVSINKVCQQAFEQIRNEYNTRQDSKQLVQALSKLLRQIAMSYCGREKVAQLTGDSWVDVLNSLSEKNYFNKALRNVLISAPYQKNIAIDADELLSVTQQWINALPEKTKRPLLTTSTTMESTS